MKTAIKKYAITNDGKYYSMKEGKFVTSLKEATIQTKSFFVWLRKKDQWHAARTLNSTIIKVL